MRYLKPYWKEITVSTTALTFAVGAELLIPQQIQRVIDDGIAVGDMVVVLRSALTMVGFALVAIVLAYINTIYSVRVSEGFAADVRDLAYRQIQRFSFGNLDRLQTGELLVRLTSDVNIAKTALLMVIRMVFRAPLMMVGSLIMLVLTSPRLALVVLVLLPVTVSVIGWFSVRTERMYKLVQRMLDRLNTILQENIAGVQVVKAFARSGYENESFGEANTMYMDRSIEVNQLVAMLLPTIFVLLSFGVTAVLWFGGLMSINGQLSTGELVAFTNYLMTSMIPVLIMGMVLPQVFASEASVDRILEIVDTEPDVTDRPGARDLVDVKGRVAFENVSLYYDGQDDHQEPVLQGISFVAEPGETVALLGATGSGKSSLVNLIPRFYDVSGGRVTVDGVDVRDATRASLRSAIGVCLQETVLFGGTIEDNVRFGSPEASHQDVLEAARIADVDSFVMEKEEGYDTVLGQRGKGLSGGQRQRVAIARALARRPKILILDDSTSSVDVATEVQIQDELAEQIRGVTQFVVAQRISTVLTADKIVLLDNGRVAGIGTHEELLATNLIYQEIYESQLGRGLARTNSKPEVGHV
jgi:ATP-binding cassette subfamily B protein